MTTLNGLPLYQLDITAMDDEFGLEAVALVDKPAIKRDFVAFAEQNKRIRFKTDNERQIISGPLLIPEDPIYRNDESGEYYVKFTADAIERIAQKYFLSGNTNAVNLNHDEGQQVNDMILFESFISDEKRGIQPIIGFEDLPSGTWFASFKVNNPDVWSEIKAGTYKGFSIEGLFAFEQVADNEFMSKESALKAIYDIISEIIES